jgi:hypothetical protein
MFLLLRVLFLSLSLAKIYAAPHALDHMNVQGVFSSMIMMRYCAFRFRFELDLSHRRCRLEVEAFSFNYLVKASRAKKEI